MGYSGAGGKLIHEKTRSKKSRDTVPLKELERLVIIGTCSDSVKDRNARGGGDIKCRKKRCGEGCCYVEDPIDYPVKGKVFIMCMRGKGIQNTDAIG
jgi:hypothetical protein